MDESKLKKERNQKRKIQILIIVIALLFVISFNVEKIETNLTGSIVLNTSTEKYSTFSLFLFISIYLLSCGFVLLQKKLNQHWQEMVHEENIKFLLSQYEGQSPAEYYKKTTPLSEKKELITKKLHNLREK